MNENFFQMSPQSIEDFLLDIRYDGPSFKGVMEIHHLGEEILGLEHCFRKIISMLKNQGTIDISEDEYELLVEAFRPGSFGKRIKLIVKNIEKYPTTAIVIVTLFVSILHAIPMYGAKEIKEMSPELMSKIADQTKIALLKDKDFLVNLSKSVLPIKENDKVFFKPPSNLSETMCIDYDTKREFLKLIEEEDLLETTLSGTIRGKVIKIDLDATKHQVDFKEDGRGSRIDCSLSEGLHIYDYTNLLGKWVEISGSITKLGEKINSILILEIHEIDPPLSEATQENIDI